MTDDERRQMMDFILTQQARFWASQQKLEEDLARLEKSQERAAERRDIGYLRVDRLERLFKLMVKAGRRARQQWREQDQRFAQQLDAMRKSGEEFDRRLEAMHGNFDQRFVDFDQRLVASREDFNQRFVDFDQRLVASREDFNQRFVDFDQRLVASREDFDQRLAASREDFDQRLVDFDQRLAASREDFDQRLAAMREAGEHTDRRLDALIDIVREQRNGKS